MSAVLTIKNTDLRLEIIPSDVASIDDLIHFAHTFNGFEVLGSFGACADLANERRATSLTEARACLFFEARRWRHFGYTPDVDAFIWWRELVARIRGFVDRDERT